MFATRRSRRPALRAAVVAAAAGVALLAAEAPALAATTQSGNQSITGTPTPQLVASLPSSTVTLPALTPTSTSTSSEQTVNVKSNALWGLQIGADSPVMQRWNGTSYVAPDVLSQPFKWAKTSQDGSPVGSPTWTDIATSAAGVVTGQAPTSDSGVDIGVSFSQLMSYADNAGIGSDSYRILVTYDAGQGF